MLYLYNTNCKGRFHMTSAEGGGDTTNHLVWYNQATTHGNILDDETTEANMM